MDESPGIERWRARALAQSNVGRLLGGDQGRGELAEQKLHSWFGRLARAIVKTIGDIGQTLIRRPMRRGGTDRLDRDMRQKKHNI
jgi:hypothetical protein